VAEGGGLLNRYTLLRRIEGSNPSVSARIPLTIVSSAADFAAEVVSCCLLQSRDSILFLVFSKA
jgi:hypothetical protein